MSPPPVENAATIQDQVTTRHGADMVIFSDNEEEEEEASQSLIEGINPNTYWGHAITSSPTIPCRQPSPSLSLPLSSPQPEPSLPTPPPTPPCQNGLIGPKSRKLCSKNIKEFSTLNPGAKKRKTGGGVSYTVMAITGIFYLKIIHQVTIAPNKFAIPDCNTLSPNLRHHINVGHFWFLLTTGTIPKRGRP